MTTAASLPQASEALTICCMWKIVRMTLGAERLNPMEVQWEAASTRPMMICYQIVSDQMS